MISQKEFSQIRPELMGDHWEFEFSKDVFYGLEFLGGRFELYSSHGVEIAFGSKVRTKPAFIRINRLTDEQQTFHNGDPSMIKTLVSNFALPCKLLMTPDELYKAIPNLKGRGDQEYYLELEWILLRFFFEEGQLSCIELFDVERCQKNVYSSHNGMIDVREFLIKHSN